MQRNFLFIISFLLLSVSSFSRADVIPIASPEGLHVLNQVETYLNNIQTMRARFVQVNQDGSSAEGVFLLKRPGRMRISYDPPIPYLVVSTGRYFIYADLELEEVTYLDPEDTIMWPLLQPNIDLRDPSLTINRVDLTNGILRVSLQQTGKPDNGILDLIFNPDPLYLRQWLITDATKQTTTITLINPVSNILLENDLFYFNPPWRLQHRERQ